MSWLFASGSQNIGASTSASVLPMNIQGWFPDWLVWSPCCPRDSQESSPAPQFKSTNSSVLVSFIVQLSHPYMTTGKTIALTIQIIVSKVMSMHFNRLSRIVTAFLPRSKHLAISGLQSTSTLITEPKKTKSVIVSTFSPSIKSDETGCHDLSFVRILQYDPSILGHTAWLMTSLSYPSPFVTTRQ